LKKRQQMSRAEAVSQTSAQAGTSTKLDENLPR
jgi:hypothetical protein